VYALALNKLATI